MRPDPHIKTLADLLVGVVLREMENPRRGESAEGSKCFLDKRRQQREHYNKQAQTLNVEPVRQGRRNT